MTQPPDRMPLSRRLIYAAGASGWQLTDRIVVLIGIYYYLPPGDVDLVRQVSDETFLGVLTAYGAARLIGGLFDSLADPLVGYGSDRSRSRLGRRRSYMIYGLVPMVAAPALLFWPAGAPGSTATFVGLTLLLVVYYVAFTVYVAPYLALMPEIAWTQADRVSLSTMLAIVGFPVIGLFPAAWPAGVALGRDLGMTGESALRAVVVVASITAFALALLPILAVDEKRHARSVPSDLPMRAALRETLRNRPFLIYLAAQIPFILGVTMLGPVVPYLSVVALGRDEGFAGLLGLLSIAPAAIGFVFVHRVAARFGPRNTVAACVALLGVLVASLGLLRPDLPGGPNDTWNLWLVCGVMALTGLPIAGFLVIPNVIIGQLIDLDASRTGANRSAMYFGAQGLLTKWAYAVSAALLAFLFAKFGASRSQPLGVLLVGPVAGVFCLVSAVIYAWYPETAVLRAVNRESDPTA